MDGDEIDDPQNNEPIVESDDLDDENELAAQAIAEAAVAAELAPEPEPEPTILEPAPTAAPEINNNPLETATPMMAPEPPPAPRSHLTISHRNQRLNQRWNQLKPQEWDDQRGTGPPRKVTFPA